MLKGRSLYEGADALGRAPNVVDRHIPWILAFLTELERIVRRWIFQTSQIPVRII